MAFRRVRTCLLLAVLAPLAGAPSAAQTPRDTVPTLIHAGRLFDSERGSFLGATDILVRNGRIDS